MAARAPGFSLYLSDICYILLQTLLISQPTAAGPFDCDWLESVVHPV
jgi:hypothetical protein